MMKPTRQMFEDGAAGDKAFRDFLGIYNSLNIEDRDMSLEGTGVSDMDPLSEKEKIRKDFEKEKTSFKDRSEERRVGKERRSRWWPYH